VRRQRTVILTWVVLLLGTAFIGSSAFSVLSADFGAGNSTESGRVAHQLQDLAESGGQLAIVVDGVDIDDAQVQRRVAAGLTSIAQLDGVLDVTDPWSTNADALHATDGRAALVVVTLAGNLNEDAELAVATEVKDLAHAIDAPKVLVGGQVLVSETFGTASQDDLLLGEAIALPIAILIMVLLLGGVIAAGMPLLVALGGVLPTLAVLVAATRLGDVSIFSINVVNMLGLGLGIDYGLLIVNRFREERGRGLAVHDAVVATVASAGRTVVFSALTVTVAMCGLFVFGVPLLTSFGIAGVAVVLLSMAAAITLLPATLAIVGGRIKPSAAVADVEGRFYRLTRWVQRRPVAVGSAAVLVLVLLGIPFLSARFETGDARTLPRSSEARATALALADRFPARSTDPVTVIADAD
jgi:putative drug exporter of the RND superfamily